MDLSRHYKNMYLIIPWPFETMGKSCKTLQNWREIPSILPWIIKKKWTLHVLKVIRDSSSFDKGIPKQEKNEKLMIIPRSQIISTIKSSRDGEPPKIPPLVDGLTDFRKFQTAFTSWSAKEWQNDESSAFSH